MVKHKNLDRGYQTHCYGDECWLFVTWIGSRLVEVHRGAAELAWTIELYIAFFCQCSSIFPHKDWCDDFFKHPYPCKINYHDPYMMGFFLEKLRTYSRVGIWTSNLSDWEPEECPDMVCLEVMKKEGRERKNLRRKMWEWEKKSFIGQKISDMDPLTRNETNMKLEDLGWSFFDTNTNITQLANAKIKRANTYWIR